MPDGAPLLHCMYSAVRILYVEREYFQSSTCASRSARSLSCGHAQDEVAAIQLTTCIELCNRNWAAAQARGGLRPEGALKGALRLDPDPHKCASSF